jgi:hypothetical protein
MKKIILVSAFIFMFLFINNAFAVNTNSSATLTVGNQVPVIVSVTPGNGDPGFCEATTEYVLFNVTDDDGWEDIDMASTYANLSAGAVEETSVSCINSSNGTTWVLINCTGINMDYYNPADNYTQTVFVADLAGGNDTDDSTNFTFNGVASVNTSDTIPFGTVYRDTSNNVNTGTLTLENCGNLNSVFSVTGSNVTGGSGARIIAFDNLHVSNSSNPADPMLEMTLSPQVFVPASNVPVYPNSGYDIGIWYYIDIPSDATIGTYTDDNLIQWTAAEVT